MASADSGYPTKEAITYSRRRKNRGSTIHETVAPSEIIDQRTAGSSQGQDRLSAGCYSLPLNSLEISAEKNELRAAKKQLRIRLYDELKLTQSLIARVEDLQQEMTLVARKQLQISKPDTCGSSSKIVSSDLVALATQIKSIKVKRQRLYSRPDHQSGTPAVTYHSNPDSRTDPGLEISAVENLSKPNSGAHFLPGTPITSAELDEILDKGTSALEFSKSRNIKITIQEDDRLDILSSDPVMMTDVYALLNKPGKPNEETALKKPGDIADEDVDIGDAEHLSSDSCKSIDSGCSSGSDSSTSSKSGGFDLSNSSSSISGSGPGTSS